MGIGRKTKRAKSAHIKRVNESNEDRNARLSKQLAYQERKLTTEVESERSKRLANARIYKEKKRFNETQAEHDARITKQLEYEKKKRFNETQAEHDARITKQCEYEKEKLFNETQAEYDARLKNQVEYERVKLINETNNDRIARLERYRKRYQNQGKFDIDSFEDEVNDTGGYICSICRKSLYKKQVDVTERTKINATIPNHILNELPDKFIVCHRCKSNLTIKKRLPSQVYWNNLDPGKIPEEIKVLTMIEIRLISRLIPFIKIVKYDGPFGQYGFKGQAILFAQDVTEVQEQILNELPRPMNNIGLVMVVEKRQNIEYQKEFEISEFRISNALKWLVENNHLYKDISLINMNEFIIDYSEIIVEGKPNSKSNEVDESVDDWHVIKYYKNTVSAEILHCSRHELHETFGIFAGKQSLSMSLSFLCKIFLKPLEYWNQLDLEYVLDEGYNLHEKSVLQFAKENHGPLESAKNDLKDIIIDYKNIETYTNLYGQSFVFLFEDIVFNRALYKSSEFENVLQEYFETHSAGIISIGMIYITLVKENNSYYIFDCRPRGAKGDATRPNKNNCYNGSAIVVKFDDFSGFVKRVKSHLSCKVLNHTKEFVLTNVQISLNQDIREVSYSTFGSVTPTLHTNPEFKIQTMNNDSGNKYETESDIESESEPNFYLNSIVLASKNQNHVSYGKCKNFQCMANSMAAIIKVHINSPTTWDSNTLDCILDAGNEYYVQCDNKRLKNSIIKLSKFLTVDELLNKNVEMYQHEINLIMAEDILDDVQMKNTLISEGLEIFFIQKGYKYGLFVCQSKTYAIMHESGYYWLFDPHSCDSYGLPCDASKGFACTIRTNIENLATYLTSRINLSEIGCLNELFSIHQVQVQIQSKKVSKFEKNYTSTQNQNEYLPGSYFSNIEMYACAPASSKFLEAIVLASKCQGDVQYKQYRNVQCLANSIVSIAMSKISPIHRWCTKTLNNILDAGNSYYIECDRNRRIKNSNQQFHPYLNIDEILENTCLFGHNFEIKETFNDILKDGPIQMSIENVWQGLTIFFLERKLSHGLFICQSKAYAIMQSESVYWLFDPHGCNPDGFPDLHGKACLIQTDLEGLKLYLNSRINFSEYNNTINGWYSIHRIDVRTEHSSLEILENTQNSDIGQIILDDIKDMMYPSKGKHRIPKKDRKRNQIKKPKTSIDTKKLNNIPLLKSIKSEYPIKIKQTIENETTVSDDHISVIEIESTTSGSSVDSVKLRYITFSDSEKKNNFDDHKFDLSPLKDALNEENQIILTKNAIERLNMFKKHLEISDSIQNEIDFVKHSPLPEEKCTFCESICNNCRHTAVYIQGASNSDNELCSRSYYIAQSLAAILKVQTLGLTSWNEIVFHNVLIAGKMLYETYCNLLQSPEFTLIDMPSDFNIFSINFTVEVEGFVKNKPLTELDKTIQSFFLHYRYGIISTKSTSFAIMNVNGFYCIFDPQKCDIEAFPDENGTACIIITVNFEKFIEYLLIRMVNSNDNKLNLIDSGIWDEHFSINLIEVMQTGSRNDNDKIYKEVVCASMPQLSETVQFLQNCICIAALVKAHISPVNSFNQYTINEILAQSNVYYKECTKNASAKIIEIKDLLTKCNLYNLKIEIDINEFHPNEDDASQENQLEDYLVYFFAKHSYGLVTFMNQTYAILKKKNLYCIFDPHKCDVNGLPSNEGSSCIIMNRNFINFVLSLTTRMMYANEMHRLNKFNEKDIKIHSINVTNNESMSLRKKNNKPPNTDLAEPKIVIPESDIFGPVSVMRPIDDFVPRPKDYFDVTTKNTNISGDNIPLKNLKRKTIKPVSAFLEKRHEELSFVALLPFGRNGVNENREIPMSELDYFQSRVMGIDSRFQIREYIFYALSMVEATRVSNAISICGKIRKDNEKVENVASNLHLTMRKVRGSSAYWGMALLDLLSMVKILGPGTAFLTLSCNDLHWEDILKECLKNDNKEHVNVSSLSIQEKQRLIENNPVVVSRKFHLRIQNIIRLLKTGDLTNGFKMKDYWYRIEFQQRGSPHCHMIIWLDNFPKLDSPEGIKAMDELCKCEIPQDDPELAALVKKYLIHRHSYKTCYKKQNHTCRFNFPRPVCSETKVLELDSNAFMQNGNRIVQMKRSRGNEMVNNYVPAILRLWKGNMDFQFVTTNTIVFYVAKYTCKSEPDWLNSVMREAIKEAQNSPNKIMRKCLFKLSMTILNEREVSACESVYRLCHLPLRGSSRDTVFVNTSKPSERFRMLRIDSDNPQDNQYYSNIIDRYQKRPEVMDYLSLGEFACKYKPYYYKKSENFAQNEEDGDQEYNAENEDILEKLGNLIRKQKLPIIKLSDGSYIQERKNPAILRSRYFSPTGDRVNYFYALLLLHLPFRKEIELLQKIRSNNGSTENVEYYQEDETEKAFKDKYHFLRPIRADCTIEEYKEFEREINDAYAQIRALMNNEGELNSTGNRVPQSIGDRFLNGTPEEEIIDMANDPEILDQPNPEIIDTRKLNSDQQKPFQLVQEFIRADIGNKNPPQIRLFITGSAGSGKSFLIERIIKLVKDAYKLNHPDSKVIIITAPTGVAARLINGQTIHSALSLGIEHGEVTKFKPLSGNYLEQKRREWQNVKFMIIDEISMVSYEMFKCIDKRLRELKQVNTAFGGINMLVLGDLLQLPPVLGNCIYKQQPYQTNELFLWRLFDFFELKQNMRQKNDQSFTDLLNALRFGQMNPRQICLLNDRVENEENGLTRSGIFADENATLIAPVIKSVEDHNSKVLKKLTTATKENPHPPKIYNFKAQDRLVENNKGIMNPDLEKIIPNDTNKTAGIPNITKLAVGARVMLRRNLSVSQGLVNGALGVIIRFEWPSFKNDQIEDGDLPECVIVQFDGIGERPIKPECFTFNARSGYGKVERRQIPLILAWAVTCHKMQGVTVESAVLDIGPDVFAKGHAYVMLSRVKNLDRLLILKSFQVQKVLKNYVNEEAVIEMHRLRSLTEVNWQQLLSTRNEDNARNKLH